MNSKWGARSDNVELRLASEQVNYISINSFQLIKSLERTPQSLVTPIERPFTENTAVLTCGMLLFAQSCVYLQ